MADVDREERIVVGDGHPRCAGHRLLVAVPQQGQVFPGTRTQVAEDLAVAGLAAERGVGEIRAQFDQLAPGRVLARDGHALRRELLVVIAVEDVGDLDAAVQVVERTARSARRRSIVKS